MSRMNHKDLEELADGVEDMREAFRAMVAGLTADGFTDEQARELIVAIMTRRDSGES